MKKFKNLKEDIIFLRNFSKKKISFNNVWENRSKTFYNLLLNKKKEINLNFFYNFRSHHKKFIAENPSIPLSNFF